MSQTLNERFFLFPITVEKRDEPQHFKITFITLPSLFAVGDIYLETEYYAYRVLSNYLSKHPISKKDNNKLAMISKYALKTSYQFMGMVLVPEDLDPHQMTTQFLIPESLFGHAHQAIDHIDELISYQP